MFELHARTVRIVLALVAAAGLQACTDRPTEPVVNPNAPRPSTSATRLACTADVASRSVRCSAPKPKANASAGPVILGGQGTYVQITAANVAYDGSSLFTADLTVQNLTAQVLGTLDGNIPDGVDVFIDTGPFGTGGNVTFTGDGTAVFNASNKPYMHYPGVLDAFGGTSAPRTWTFQVPSSVQSFTFTLLVSANVPENAGVLRWNVERGSATFSNRLVYGMDRRNVFAFGSNQFSFHSIAVTCDCVPPAPVNIASRFDGSAWHAINSSFPFAAAAAWAASPTDLWVVGPIGQIARYNGSTWTSSGVGEANLTAIWGSSSMDVYVIGGDTILHFDGSVWSAPPAPAATYTAIYGNSVGDVYAIGYDVNAQTVLSHFDGSMWTSLPVDASVSLIQFNSLYVHGPDVWAVGPGGAAHYAAGVWQAFPQAAFMTGVHGTDASNVWAIGFTGSNLSIVATILRWDPGHQTWIADPSPPAILPYSVWTSGPNDVWAIALDLDDRTFGIPWHWDGTSWSAVGSQLGAIESANHHVTASLNATFGADASSVWAVGTTGQILNSTGSGWQQVGPRNVNISWNSVWGTADNDIWVVGDSGQVRHWDGHTLQSVVTPSSVAGESLKGVYGFSMTDVWAVGNAGSIIHYNGTAWSDPVNPTGCGLNAIWGPTPTNIWAVGVGCVGIAHFTSSAWTIDSSSNFASELFAIAPDANGFPVAVGQGGVIYRDTGGWAFESSNTTVDLFGIYSDGVGGHLLAVGAKGTMVQYAGGVWNPVQSPVANDIHGIWMSSFQNIFTVGVGEFIAHGMR